VKVITRTTFDIGGPGAPRYVAPGTTVELDDAEARRVLKLGHADPAPESDPPDAADPAAPEPATVSEDPPSAPEPARARRRGRT
jgi:hypothetical protein